MTAAYPGRVTVHKREHRRRRGLPRVAREVIDQHGRLDILVNNGGITVDKTVHKMTDDDWLRVISVPACDLAAKVVREAVSRAGLEPGQVGQAVFGNVIHSGTGTGFTARAATARVSR